MLVVPSIIDTITRSDKDKASHPIIDIAGNRLGRLMATLLVVKSFGQCP